MDGCYDIDGRCTRCKEFHPCRCETGGVRTESAFDANYHIAVGKLAVAVDAIKKADLFLMSSVLAVLYDKPKEETLNDLLGARQQMLGISRGGR